MLVVLRGDKMKSMFLNKLFWLKELGLSEVKMTSSQAKLLASRQGNLKAGLLYWCKKGMVKKKGGVLTITKKGVDAVYKEFPTWKKIDKKWDRKWLFLAFDLPIKNKNRRFILRRLLIRYKFGLFQQSLFVSPLNVFEEVKRDLKIKRFGNFEVLLFRVAHREVKIPIGRIWHLDDFEKKYRELAGNRNDTIRKARYLFERFIRIKEDDVCLPAEINPIYGSEKRAKQTLARLVKLL